MLKEVYSLVITTNQAKSRGQPPKKRVKVAPRDLHERLFNLRTAERDGSKTVIHYNKRLVVSSGSTE